MRNSLESIFTRKALLWLASLFLEEHGYCLPQVYSLVLGIWSCQQCVYDHDKIVVKVHHKCLDNEHKNSKGVGEQLEFEDMHCYRLHSSSTEEHKQWFDDF